MLAPPRLAGVSLEIGIVGLPNVGKSTLFNALTRAGAVASNYPFATIEPNVGIVGFPDPRLEALAGLYNSARIVPATVRFVDAHLGVPSTKGDLGREERRQGRLCGSKPALWGSATWSLFPLSPAWQAWRGGCKGAWYLPSGGTREHPCAVIEGQAAADEVAQVEGSGAVLEPGVVAGDTEGARFEAPPAAAGDLGDDPLDVGAVLAVVLPQGHAESP